MSYTFKKLVVQMYRTDFWTLWEKPRVGCFKRTACILSIVKQITSPGGMHETSARAWCTGKTRGGSSGIRRRGRWEGISGWGIHVTPWLIHVNVWHNPLKCCEVISLQLIKIYEKKRKGYGTGNTSSIAASSPRKAQKPSKCTILLSPHSHR